MRTLVLATLLLVPLAALHAAERPNIVLFLVDDMGWMDSGVYGSKYYETPNIDRLAARGMRFTQAYAQPLCSPTRASLLTGQYSARHGITSATGHVAPQPEGHVFIKDSAPSDVPMLMPESKNYLEPAQITLAETLKSAGYRTAHIGKWHVGRTEPHWPEQQGFDVAFHCHPDAGPPGDYFSPYLVLPNPVNNPKFKLGTITDGPKGEYIVDRQAEEAVKFIASSKGGPFFLNLWCYGVHGPWRHKPEYTQAFMDKKDPTGQHGNPIMASMLKSVDECLGRIVNELDKQGIADNTIVVFVSDNGGNTNSHPHGQGSPAARQDWLKWAGKKVPTNNTPLRDGKGTLYEGGTRVPLMWAWAGKIAPGSSSEAVVGPIDVYPTLLDLLGIAKPEQQHFDGVSYAKVLKGEGKLDRAAYFNYFPHGGKNKAGGVTVRSGDFKLLRWFGNPNTHELYNLRDDLSEATDLAAQLPEKVKELDAHIDGFLKETGATYPRPNPAYQPANVESDQRRSLHDVVVYGDSSGAVVAAIAAKREGRSVIWVNPTGFAGGMSSSGLGATDFLGRQTTFGGIAAEFYAGVAKSYGTNFVRSFEPHVGKQVFEKLIAAAGVTVVYNEKLDRTPGKGVTMDGQRIKAITTLSGKTYQGRMFIDATYVGDLMAAAGVTYTVGREPDTQYGESLAGVRRGDTSPRVHYRQKDKDHFIKAVEPFIEPGDPSSGLLLHVHRIEGLKNGQGDKKIQAYNYRVCLTTDPENRIPIEKPPGYREIDHELLLRNFDAGDNRLPALVEPLAGDKKKVDWNNMHAVGSDYAGANWEYPEASYERRREIEQAHEIYLRGFLWTMANNPRVPEEIRRKTAAYGLPKDEFTDNGGWPWMIYIREARRMVGDYVMTQLDCEGQRKAPDPVALGSFGMDSHCVQHFVTDHGKVQNEGVIWRVPPKPYGISYRAIVPKKGECENLYSPICLSASHVAHGSIRMEPVFMALSQSAAIAAGIAIDSQLSVQDVPYATLLNKLEAAKQIARPEAVKLPSSKKNGVATKAKQP